MEAIGHPAARVGGAQIELVSDGRMTRLGSLYQQIPLRVLPAFAFDREPASLLYLITLTTGLMDGDSHLLDIAARAGTRAVVTGQSATRIHPTQSSFAAQNWYADVEDDAILVVLPGPAIPYAGSRFFQRGRITLAPTARMIWGDIWLAGRYNRGTLSERFQFERIVQDFEVRRARRLIYRDRFSWNGPWNPQQAAWSFGGELAAASLFVAGTLPEVLPPADVSVRRSLFRMDQDVSGFRWVGPPGAVTADLVRITLSIAGNWTGGPTAAPWLLESTDLAANHWFSKPAGR
ncbi:MAG: urease accessory protein UreD [Bacteroidales bacterium]|nr:urease accessory protein UreD [Bacteroidales bacterium]